MESNRKTRPLWLGLCLALSVWVAGGAAAQDRTNTARRIMTGDRINVSVVEAPEVNRVYPVAGDGTIHMPLVGRVEVAEMTSDAAAAKIEALLEKEYFKNASVSIDVAEYVEGSIMVLGAVAHPGAIPFKGDEIMTLFEAIGLVGGMTGKAAADQVRILRWKPGGGMERETIIVDMKAMLETLDFSKDQFLRPRDIVMVPELGGQRGGEFLILGEVGSPGFYPAAEGMDVIRAITQAGGVKNSSKMNATRILRPGSDGAFKVIPIDLFRLFGAADVSVNVAVQAGDIIFVPSADQAAKGKVYLLGQVEQQGAIPLPLEGNATLARTILGNGGLGKFAAGNKVRILRNAPDGSKQTLVVDVERILKTGSFEDDVPLQDEDVIMVPESIIGF